MKRIKYYTMNSWNLSTSLAYNLKVYNVIPEKYQDRCYELMEYDGFYDNINTLIEEFDQANNYEYQAGFNGRSGGYIVLYKGGIEDGRVFTRAGLGLEPKDVPADVKRRFKKLANDIVKETIYMCVYATIETETVEHERKYISI